ncbi:MAG: helix-hairpin-helix domain-containing protein [Acidimicrobiia bacterium]
MKRFLKLTGFVAGLAGALWLMRDRLISLALPREPEPPTFRVGPGEPPDDLTEIKGVGGVFAGRLASIGIATFQDLARSDAATVAQHLDTQSSRVEDWIAQARLRTT